MAEWTNSQMFTEMQPPIMIQCNYITQVTKYH